MIFLIFYVLAILTFSLLDFGMVFLARISGLQPVFQNPQSQTTNLKFYFRE
jgi:hypothetical protein